MGRGRDGHRDRWLAVWMVVAISLLATGRPMSVLAQGSAITCDPPASPVSTAPAAPAATVSSSPAAVEPVPFPAGGGTVRVFAAASLTDSFEAIGRRLEDANSELRVEYNFAGSPALVAQLNEGAEADVFASASVGQMKAAQEAGVAGEATLFTQNRLAIVVPADNPGGVASTVDLAKDGLKLVLAQPEVPVGQYAREAICKMQQDSATYGANFAGRVAANVVSEENNVRAVLSKVQLGEADAGIVYTTDATAEVAGEIRLVKIPAAVNVIAHYPIAPVRGGDAELAAAFISYILGSEGQAALVEAGFEPRT